MIFADTELDADAAGAMRECCASNFADFRERAPYVVVDFGQEIICPTCGSALMLSDDARWRPSDE